MAVKFKLVERRNLGSDKNIIPTKHYAQAVKNGYVTFDELCGDISDNCTLTSADVKAVMDRMNFCLDKHLRAGRIVQFGEIGNFRMAVGSSGSVEANDFSTSQIRRPKIVFAPGSALRQTRRNAKFERAETASPPQDEAPPASNPDLIFGEV
ncbi:MAG: DsbA family protein [Bacteroidales bacterium]